MNQSVFPPVHVTGEFCCHFSRGSSAVHENSAYDRFKRFKSIFTLHVLRGAHIFQKSWMDASAFSRHPDLGSN